MVVRLHIYSKKYQNISPSEGSGQDHNHSPTPLAERARIAHHSETNPIPKLQKKKKNTKEVKPFLY